MSLDAEKLYTDYYRKVRSFIASRVNSYQDAEDLTSDVFVKVYKKLDTFDPKKANVSTWIYTIARNTVIDFYRTSNQTLEYDDSILIEDDEGESIINEDNLEILAKVDMIFARAALGRSMQAVPPKLNTALTSPS